MVKSAFSPAFSWLNLNFQTLHTSYDIDLLVNVNIPMVGSMKLVHF